MCTLIMIICLVVSVIFGIMCNKKLKVHREENPDEVNEFGKKIMATDFASAWISFVFGCVAAVLLFVFIIPEIKELATAHTIEQSIEMYQEENEKIEESIGVIVRDYLTYEQKTYEELSDKDAIYKAQVYPELQSNELVKAEIEVYIENNKQIKELKKKQIELSNLRWDVYFGK